MFARCPHCGFLVALIVARAAPTRCPQCDGALQPGAPRATPGMDDADDTDVAPPASVTSTPTIETDADDVPSTPATAADTTAPDTTTVESAGDEATTAPPADPLPDATAEDGDESDIAPPPASAQAMDEPVTIQVPSQVASAGASGNARARGNRLHSAPSFARRSISMVESGPRWPGIAIIVALIALLALQSLLAQRAELGRDARWRPTLVTLCNVLRCDLPPWREPAAFAMLNRSVRPSPTRAGVLEITATFRNDARWPQPWPALLLTLSDLDGQTVGARAFQPKDYRDDRVIGDTLAPGQSVTVLLDVVEPAPNVVAFTFDFH